MQLQGIVFIQLQGNDIIVNCHGNKFIQRMYIYSQKSIIIRGNCILSRARNYIHFKELISSFKEIYLVQGKHIHSGKLYPFKEIYSFKEHIYSFKFKAICSFKETIVIEHCCVRGHSRNIYSKIVPSHFMIIKSFTITIS